MDTLVVSTVSIILFYSLLHKIWQLEKKFENLYNTLPNEMVKVVKAEKEYVDHSIQESTQYMFDTIQHWSQELEGRFEVIESVFKAKEKVAVDLTSVD
jgi:hypothetical protein